MRNQDFDDIKISEKGMIKLVRDRGKDYIFPASEIIKIWSIKPKKIDYGPLNLVVKVADFFGKGPKDTRENTLCLETENGDLYINIPYSNILEDRIYEAMEYSKKISEEKYGVFK